MIRGKDVGGMDMAGVCVSQAGNDTIRHGLYLVHRREIAHTTSGSSEVVK